MNPLDLWSCATNPLDLCERLSLSDALQVRQDGCLYSGQGILHGPFRWDTLGLPPILASFFMALAQFDAHVSGNRIDGCGRLPCPYCFGNRAPLGSGHACALVLFRGDAGVGTRLVFNRSRFLPDTLTQFVCEKLLRRKGVRSKKPNGGRERATNR